MGMGDDAFAFLARAVVTCPVDPGYTLQLGLAEMVNEARRATLFCGAGCANARAEVLSLAETLKSPIVHALRGKEYLEYDNPTMSA